MGQDRQTLGIVRRIELTIGVLFAIGFAGCGIYVVGTIQHFVDEVVYRSALMMKPPRAPTAAPPTSPFVHQAAYPSMALRSRQEGTVVVEIVIGKDGAVQDAAIDKSSGSTQLDAAALIAVGDWRYPPPVKDGKPAVERRKVAVVFKIQD